MMPQFIKVKNNVFYIQYVVMMSMLILLFFCSNDYNPFKDISNANAEFSGIKNGDSLAVFSTKILTMWVTLPDEVEQVKITVESNRLFSDTIVDAGRFPVSGPVKIDFKISFFDTGWKKITAETMRRNGNQVYTEMAVRVLNPLRQDTVRGALGSSVTLFTVPVVDSGEVVYTWAFNNGFSVQSLQNRLEVLAQSRIMEGTGQLRVSDRTGKHLSPDVQFVYSFYDTVGPSIVCVNDGNVGKDTVMSSEREFFFRVHITDMSSIGINNATINGEQFTIVEGEFYIKKMLSIDTGSGTRVVKVRATDRNSNISEKMFIIKFDSLSSRNNPPEITFPRLDNDTGDADRIASTNPYKFLATLQSYSTEVINADIQVEVNNTAVVRREKVAVSIQKNTMEFTVNVNQGNNVIALELFSIDGKSLNRREMNVIYDKEAHDVVPPKLIEVSINKQVITPLNTAYVTSTNPVLQIMAFDDGSGIKQVLVDSKECPKDTGNDYVWKDTITVEHSPEGTKVRIELRDGAENTDTTELMLKQNSIPVIYLPVAPKPLLVDSLYVDIIKSVDPENDKITYKTIDAPDNFNFDTISGRFSWKPDVKDTGLNVIIFKVSDTYEDTIVTLPIIVSQFSPKSLKIKNVIAPSVIEAGQEARIVIITDTTTNQSPIRYSGKIVNGENLAFNNETCIWKPAVTDTGLKEIVLNVIDRFDSTDMAMVHLKVIPKSDSITFTEIWNGTKTSSGNIDVRTGFGIDTLFFIIADSYFKDRGYNYSVSFGTEKPQVNRMHSETLLIPINPLLKNSGLDSVTITIADEFGHSTIQKRYIEYGNLVRPDIISPAVNSTIADSIQLIWNSCGRSIPVNYEVYFGSIDAVSPVPQITIPDTCITLNVQKSGRYYAYIKALRGDSTRGNDTILVGKALIFPIMVSDRVRIIDSLVPAMPPFFEADKDSLVFTILTRDGVGPLRFSTIGILVPNFLVDSNSGMVRFVPTSDNLGITDLKISVQDSIGNTDSLFLPPVLIVPRNRPCSISVSPAINGRFDMSMQTTDVKFEFSVHDPDSFAIDKHIVKVKLLNSESVVTLDSTRKFSITVSSDDYVKLIDTIQVVVSDRGGLADTITGELFFGKDSTVLEYKQPGDNGIVSTDTVRFEWKWYYEGTESVTYDIYIDTIPDLQTPAETGLLNSQHDKHDCIVNKTYFWKVVAHAGALTVSGPVSSFTYQYSRKILIATAGILEPTEVINDVPVLIRLDSSHIDFATVNPNDLKFSNSSGQINYPYDIESWDIPSRSALVWVLVDTIFGINYQDKYVKFDIAKGNGTNLLSAFNQYNAVWHMNPTDSIIRDVSGNNNNGIYKGITSGSISERIGNAITTDNSRFIQVAHSTGISLGDTIQIEAWIKIKEFLSDYAVMPILKKGNEYQLSVGSVLSNKFMWTVANTGPAASDSSCNPEQWYYLVARYPGGSNDGNLIVNGELQPDILNGNITVSEPVPLGIGVNPADPNHVFSGYIDEVRISKKVRSLSWIRFSYENQKPESDIIRIE